MKTNVGETDRNIRLVVGAGALAAGLLAPMSMPLRIGALALAASEFFTATTRYCPLNEALGINTHEKELQSKKATSLYEMRQYDSPGEKTAPAAAI